MSMPPQDLAWAEGPMAAMATAQKAATEQVLRADLKSKLASACTVLADLCEHLHGSVRVEDARTRLGAALVDFMAAVLADDRAE